MRALCYFVAVSLDGFIATPDGRFDAFPMSGDHIDALLRDYPETLPSAALSAMGVKAQNETFDTVVMGWNTFAVGLSAGQTDPYGHLRSYVFSRSHSLQREQASGGVSVSDEEPRRVVQRLKAEPSGKGIWLCGGGTMARVLEPEIDSLFLKVNPIVLGSGIKLFADLACTPRAFELRHSRSFRSGVVWNSYERAERCGR